MRTSEMQVAGLFVDNSRPRHWIARDPHVNFWMTCPVTPPGNSAALALPVPVVRGDGTGARFRA